MIARALSCDVMIYQRWTDIAEKHRRERERELKQALLAYTWAMSRYK